MLVLTSFTRAPTISTPGFTTHYWVGGADPGFAQGQRGVLASPNVLDAALTTLGWGLAVAVVASILGIVVGYTVTRLTPMRWLSQAISVLSFLPFLFPGIAFGAAFIALFGGPIGPFPSLYVPSPSWSSPARPTRCPSRPRPAAPRSVRSPRRSRSRP